jgi:tetratricopeptide (TPR) repeat protein
MENPANSISQSPSLNQLQAIADAQVAPQLLKLKSDPNNPELLANIGNVYYDAQQYPTAVDYYGRALKAKPSDAAVRTDLGTAYWFMGNADSALTEFNKALTYAPTNPNTLFNRGLVRLKGKQDPAGAISDFEKLLATNPNYEGKDNVEKMMAEAKKQPAVSEEATAK